MILNIVKKDNFHINKNCFWYFIDKLIVEKNVVFSMHSTFMTHIDMLKSQLSKVSPAKSKKIIIGENCYIDPRTTILRGLELEEKTLVAICSTVTKLFFCN